MATIRLTINIYNNLNKNVNLDDYKYLKNLLDLKANELLRIKDIKEIKQIKVYKNKENVDLNINNIIKDLMNFLNHYGKNDLEQVKEILESCIEITETILKARKPFLYYKFKLKKMKYFRILQSTVTSLRNVSSGKRYEAKLKRDIVKNKDILQYEFA